VQFRAYVGFDRRGIGLDRVHCFACSRTDAGSGSHHWPSPQTAIFLTGAGYGQRWRVPEQHPFGYCSEHNIVFTRGRAYHKNDQAWVEQKNGAIVRKLIGYGRLEGLTATAALRHLYESSRLYINFFQPSFKLDSKHREGARVHKKYHPPETPYHRLIQHDDVPSDTKQMLRQTMEGLDPVLLLKQIRDAQDTVMALSQNRTPEPAAPDVAAFVSSLATAWRAGEVRPTHRREPKPGHWWRTRKDPFAEVWPVLLGWLEEKPDMEAKEMLKRLQASGYGEFPDGQLRTLQRRVRLWRVRIVRQLVYGTDQTATNNHDVADLNNLS
jgi:hypothetical protein